MQIWNKKQKKRSKEKQIEKKEDGTLKEETQNENGRAK